MTNKHHDELPIEQEAGFSSATDKDDKPLEQEDAVSMESIMDQLGIDETKAKSAASAQDLQAQCEEFKQKAEENWGKYVRALADADNLRKRLEGEVKKTRDYGNQKIIEALLPCMDSLMQGQQAIKEATSLEEAQDLIKAMREGMELMEKMVLEVLGKFGVEILSPEGQAYNAHFHEAMTMQPQEGVGPGQVIAVIQKGYVLNGRVIRPARVIVSK